VTARLPGLVPASAVIGAALVVAVTLGAAGCAPAPPASVEVRFVDPAFQLLEQRQDQLFAALAARDADATAALFADDAALYIAGMPPVQGAAAIRQFYGNLFRFLTASTATPGPTHVSASRDMAYSTGRASNEFGGPGGATTYEGKYVVVWRRLDDDWRVVLYAVSSNQPDAARQSPQP
jgi:uncharacterized protein (TIGR02246 family)